MPSAEPLAHLAQIAEQDASVFDICRAADQAAQAAIGHGLFTVMRFLPNTVEVERLYSSNPDAYPPGGRKQKKDTPWGRHVLDDAKPYIGQDADDIRWAFNDADLILGLGLGSVLNMPIVANGKVIGTMNLLHSPGHFTDAHLDTAAEIASHLININQEN